MQYYLKVKNPSGELLDVLVEGNPDSTQAVIMAHGFGTDKHEHGLFDSLVDILSPNHLTIRFDFSGYGNSEGNQVDVNYHKQAKDLGSIIAWTNSKIP